MFTYTALTVQNGKHDLLNNKMMTLLSPANKPHTNIDWLIDWQRSLQFITITLENMYIIVEIQQICF